MRVAQFIEHSGGEALLGRGSKYALLKRFQFDGARQYVRLERLSGGERRRLQLLSILARQPNVLLLDEPTNDLSIDTIEVLEDILDNFEGVVIMVSHDRAFMDRICDHLLVFEGGGEAMLWQGSFTELERHRAENEQQSSPGASNRGQGKTASDSDITYLKQLKRKAGKAPKEIAVLEAKLEAIDAEIEELNTRMMQTGSDASEAIKLNAAKLELEAKQTELYTSWEELEAIVEEATAAGLM